MPELEDYLKLQNWLSVLTFDVYKFARAGGNVTVEWHDDALILRLPGIAPDTPGVNSKLRLVGASTPAPPQEQPTP